MVLFCGFISVLVHAGKFEAIKLETLTSTQLYGYQFAIFE